MVIIQFVLLLPKPVLLLHLHTAVKLNCDSEMIHFMPANLSITNNSFNLEITLAIETPLSEIQIFQLFYVYL